MKIVVAGGTGFIGRRLVRELAARGDEIVVLTRGENKGQDTGGPALPNVHFVRWAPETDSDATIGGLVREASAIYNLAGAGVMDARWSEARLRELRQSRVVPTSKLARAAASEGVQTFVSASAVGMYGMHMDDTPLDEEGDHGSDVLATMCEAWEEAAEPAARAGVRVIFPRFGIVLGADGGALKEMVPPFKAFVGGPLGSGKQWVSFIHVGDAVRSLLFAFSQPTMRGPYNCTAPSPVRMDRFAEALGKALHRPAAIRTPAFALKLALGDRAEVLLSGQRVLPAKLEALGFRFDFPSVDRALGDLFAAGN
jgi:uncharacterized protein (TIGR01777 family)